MSLPRPLLSNITPMRDALEDAVKDAWQTYLTADTNWADAVLNLAIKVWDLRCAPGGNVEFGASFNALDLRRVNGNPLDTHDRPALWKMGKFADCTRQALATTKSRSFRLIWDDDVSPLVPENELAAVNDDDDTDTDTSDNSSEPSLQNCQNSSEETGDRTPSLRERVARGRVMQGQGIRAAAIATALGLVDQREWWQAKCVDEKAIDTVIEAIDQGRLSISRAKTIVMPNAGTINPETLQRELLAQALGEARGTTRTRRAPATTAASTRGRGRPAGRSSGRGKARLGKTPGKKLGSKPKPVPVPAPQFTPTTLSGLPKLTREEIGRPENPLEEHPDHPGMTREMVWMLEHGSVQTRSQEDQEQVNLRHYFVMLWNALREIDEKYPDKAEKWRRLRRRNGLGRRDVVVRVRDELTALIEAVDADEPDLIEANGIPAHVDPS
jgi:hypothetical protein